MALTKADIKELVAEQKQDLVQEMDMRFETQDEQNKKRAAVQDKEIDSKQRKFLIPLEQQFRKTNGLIADVAKQLQVTRQIITHVLEKQVELEERIEKLEEQVSTALTHNAQTIGRSLIAPPYEHRLLC